MHNNRTPVTERRSSRLETGKGIFLDRDGTIIRDAHYLGNPDEIVLLPGVAKALTLLREAGFSLFLFTNQSGVGRGHFTLETVHRCNDRMIALLGMDGPVFVEVCIAPERPDEPSRYRKPNPRFINECVTKYRLDRALSWMVGDKPSDVEAGLNAGIKAALVNGAETNALASGVLRYHTLYDFAQAVTNGAR